MFTQFFGSYLLNKKFVTSEQLKDALDYQKSVHLKLGVLAVNAGFMSVDQVNAVHSQQAKVDKKFGEIAIDMGFLDDLKLNTLLSTQKTGHLLLGQALVDRGYMNLEKFKEAVEGYKKEYSITNESLQKEDIDEIVKNYYKFSGSVKADLLKQYTSLLIRNIIRFIDDEFKPLEVSSVKEYKSNWIAIQDINGEEALFTAIAADEKPFIGFAEKYAGEKFEAADEYTQASVGEFLNLVNGLFLVNMSNNNIELELDPQVVEKDKSLNLYNAFSVPFEFSFGKVEFIIAAK